MNYNVRLTSEQLKQLRIIKGISVRKFGRSVDLSAAYISLMENGKRTIPPKVENVIRKEYGLTDRELMKLAYLTDAIEKVGEANEA
ncbi:helix-turn-helix domain-containing protein [Halobacillus halophilus]|uniref:helix-turn-helix domain-containing protein n=1 Tax=Halobacillus halophilus TaxID=1570 RepID=UPI0005A2F15E|nr:helix-turn-helix transcriptional regulator [Halobacillus halophilus]